MKYSFNKKILPTLCLLVSLAGCIKEDRSECNPGVLLKYDYSLNTEYVNLFGAKVRKVTVYVFDENGFYYGCYVDEGAHLTNDYRMYLPLPAGNYTMVVWGGTLGTYFIGEADSERTIFQSLLQKGITHIDNFMLLAGKDVRSLEQLDDLWHGNIRATSVYWVQDPVTISLMKNTKSLTVKLKDATIGNDRNDEIPYRVRCEGANAQYMADNSFGKKSHTVTYLPHDISLTRGMMTAKLDLLRLVEGNPVRLVVENRTGKIVFDKDLVRELMRPNRFGTQEELDREDELEVVITRDNDITLTVTINGWDVVEVIPEL